MSESATVTNQIDQSLAFATLCASIQCYSAYNAGDAFPTDPTKYVTAPPGYEYRDFWYGQDVFDEKPIHELVVFGLVFAATDGSNDFIFAFRGTKGYHEWIDDLKIGHDAFKPAKPGNGPAVPADARAEEGFSEIYYSMQSALFGLVEKYSPARVLITGHSLGSSLCELFTLDLAISSPGQATTTYNFACPRTGNATFASFYDSLTLAKGNPTLRVVNTKDIVPCVPPEFLGFRHVGVWYPVCFEEQHGILPDYGVRHSADNYYVTLERVFGEKCPCQLEAPGPDPLDFCTPDPGRECDLLAAEFAASRKT